MARFGFNGAYAGNNRAKHRRLTVTAATLAPLAGTPAILAVAHVHTPWVLASATALAGAIGWAGVGWRDQYQRRALQLEEQATEIQDGCLMIGGRLPKVAQVRDPLSLGVHPAAPVTEAGPNEDRLQQARVPVYVPRDVDDELCEQLASGGFILLVGDSTAGKSRTAYEAIRATLPDHTLIAPNDREALPSALAKAADTKQCVLWLNDLQNYLGAGPLTRNKITSLRGGGGQHRVILATMRAVEETRYTSNAGNPEAARQAHRNSREVLEQAHRIHLPRMFSAAERERAKIRDWDLRIRGALDQADDYGIAEYLAAAPELLRDWQNGDTPNTETDPDAPANPRGAALVRAAIEIRRAGWADAIPKRLLEDVHEHYLAKRLQPESMPAAWEWALRPRRATTALLERDAEQRVQVFDYLVDVEQRKKGPSDHVLEPVVRKAVDAANPSEADALGATAFTQGRYPIAEYAYRHAYEARLKVPGADPEDPDALASRNNLALTLKSLGKLDEAEVEHREVGQALRRAFEADVSQTLTNRNDLARVLRTLGQFEDAEREHRAVRDDLLRLFGEKHPDTLAASGDLARVLQQMGRLKEAAAEHEQVLRIREELLDPEHPSTLASRGSLASVLHDLGRLEEAEAEHREVLRIREELLGKEHPRTLTSRGDFARVLHDLGRLDEAEKEQRAVRDSRVRVLGPDHHRTLASRGVLATIQRDKARILRDQKGLEDARNEHSAVLAARTSILGPDHPRTLTSRSDLAEDMFELGQLTEAEAEHRAVVRLREQKLGSGHPDTLRSRHNLARTLHELGRIDDAEIEYRETLKRRTETLGADHPSTLASQDGLASVR